MGFSGDLTAAEIREIISDTERSIKVLIDRLHSRIGVEVKQIEVIEEDGSVGILTYREPLQSMNVDNTNSTFKTWMEKVDLMTAFCNLDVEMLGGEKELQELFDGQCTPYEAIRSALDME